MHHLTGPSTTRLRRYSWLFIPGLIVILLSLFVSIFSDIGSRAHATSLSSHENTREGIFIHHGPPDYHVNGLMHSSKQLANSSHVNQIKLKQPALMLTRTNSSDMSTDGTHHIEYVLSVSNGHLAGPVTPGNTITISNSIPGGVTDLTTRVKKSDWNVHLASKTGPTILTATYIGAYPVLAGTSLSPIIVHGTLAPSNYHHLLLPAVVRLLHTNNQQKNSATLLQQQSAHVFTVTDKIRPKKTPQGGSTPKKGPTSRPTPKKTPQGRSTPKKGPTSGPTPKGITPQVVPTYQPGQTVVYTLSVTNDSAAGPVLTGDSISITDSIPAGLTALTASATTPADWTVSLSGTTSPTTLTATYTGSYPVAAGAILSPITITGTLTSAALPQVTNTAVVVTPNDSNNANNFGTNVFNVVPLPDLTVTDPVPPGTTFEVGKPVTYTLTGSNLSTAGPVLASDPITITDTIPAGLTGITATASNTNWSLSLSATSGPATLTATYIGSYPVNGGTTFPPITITGTLTSAAISTLANTATINTPKDNDSANNTASNSITVVPQPDLTITKTIPASGSLQVGHSVTYALVVSNGSSAGPVLTGDPITVTDTIPAGFNNLTTSANSDWSVSLANTTSPTTMTATYTGSYPVAPGTTFSTISLIGTLTAASHPQVTNTALVSTPNDGNTDNNGASITSPVLLAPDLSLSKTVTLAAPTVRRQSQEKHPGKAFRAAIGIKNTRQAKPALHLSGSKHLIPTFQGGQQVTYNLTISNNSNAGPVIEGDPVVLVDKIPAGLTDLNATADSTYWQTSLDATTSPTTLTATYVGPYPVLPGAMLPAVTLNGTLTGDASQLTNTAQVKTPDDTGSTGINGHTGTTTIKVIPAPDMAIKKSNFGGHVFYPGQMVQYELRTYCTNASGPINKTIPIRVLDILPASAYQVKAYGKDWSIAIEKITEGTRVVATYTGHYPLAAGSWLPRIIVDARFRGHDRSSRINTAQVIIPYDKNPDNNTARDAISIQAPALPPTGSDPNA